MRTANPALNKNTFRHFTSHNHQKMTIDGTVNKSMILFLLLIFAATFVWSGVKSSWNPGGSTPLMIVGLILGLIFSLITIFKKEWSPITAPIYALCEGLFLGGLSALFDIMYPGIVIQAVALTFGTFFCLLFAYKTGLIKATENFKLGVVAATGAVAMIYVITLILGLFGIGVPFIHDSGLIGIIFSLVVVVIAALNLVLDFDFIEQGAEQGAPKYMEWYASFGLLVTLVWLYIEILRLLAKLRGRD